MYIIIAVCVPIRKTKAAVKGCFVFNSIRMSTLADAVAFFFAYFKCFQNAVTESGFFK